jgi:hypothetical protein
VCDYVHLNPARANLIKPGIPLREYPWSTWPEYLKKPGKRSGWLRVDRLLGEYHISEDNAAGRRRLEEALEQRRGLEEGDAFKPIRRGWFLGKEALKQELLAQVSKKAGKWHYGEAVQESAEAKAERIVTEELRKWKWDDKVLASRRKGDAGKVAVAERLRRETTMTLEWIARRLRMGTKTHLAHLLYWKRRNEK